MATTMSRRDDVLRDLIIGNRVLSHEGVVDAYGHISVRSPDSAERFFLSRSLAPEFVRREDIIEFGLDGEAAGGDSRTPYIERFIHSAIYAARPDVMSVVHAHAEDVLPFGISQQPLAPVIHSGAFIGGEVPVWDIADRFGDETNLLVTNGEQGDDLAQRLGDKGVVLMRGHGFAAAAGSIVDVVRMSIYLPRNARALMKALQMGAVKPLSRGEIDARSRGGGYRPDSPETWRAWQYWAHRAGCGDMLPEQPRA
jgi:HCOMODA/2-hydroxy-3-carboxy-muconic semialdehyde decarboxylase